MKELLIIIILLLLIISIQLYISKPIKPILVHSKSSHMVSNEVHTSEPHDIENKVEVVSPPVVKNVETRTNVVHNHNHNHNHRLSAVPEFRVPHHKVVDNVHTNPPPTTHIPINIPTRGPSQTYRQIGVLTNSDNSLILPLFGRSIWNGSSKWNYYTQTDKFVSVHLPVFSKNKDCSAEYGCEELFDKEEVTVPQFNETFVVTLYHLEGPRYIPVVY